MLPRHVSRLVFGPERVVLTPNPSSFMMVPQVESLNTLDAPDGLTLRRRFSIFDIERTFKKCVTSIDWRADHLAMEPTFWNLVDSDMP